MKTIYVISKFFTFPGSFTKGFLEHVVCRILGVDIYAADRYVSRNELSGHVAILPPKGYVKSFFVCFLPGLFSFLIGAGGYFCSLFTLGLLGVGFNDAFSGAKLPLFFVYCFFLWFGGSFMCNLFPYSEDTLHMWKTLYSPQSKANAFAKAFLFIPALIIYIGTFLEKFGLTLIINIAVAAFVFKDYFLALF